MSLRVWLPSPRWRWRLGVIVIIPIGLAAVLWLIPLLLTRPLIDGLTNEARLDALNAVRGSVVQALGAIGLLGGLLYTARTYRLSLRGQELARASHITDRYAESVSQLGSDSINVRLGAVYSLERLMHDSPDDQPTIVEVLAAFVRVGGTGKSSENQDAHTSPAESGRSDLAEWRREAPPTDIEAAMGVLARRPEHPGESQLNLSRARLKGLLIKTASLRRSNLEEADLAGARLSRADLREANLWGANLLRVGLDGADLRGAYLARAHMHRASFGGADLTAARLGFSDLTGAYFLSAKLLGADLREADLRGAHLSASMGDADADLTDADVTGAMIDKDAVSCGQLQGLKGAENIVWQVATANEDAQTLSTSPRQAEDS